MNRLFLLLLLLISGFRHANIIAWDGDAGNRDWFDPLNWQGDVVPFANDDVIRPSNKAVSLECSTIIQSLAIEGTLVIESKATLGVIVGLPDGVTITGGSLTVDGTLDISLVERYGIHLTFGELQINGTVTINQVSSAGVHSVGSITPVRVSVIGVISIFN